MKSKEEIETRISNLIRWNAHYANSIKENIPNNMHAAKSALDRLDANNCELDTLNWIITDD